MPTNENVKVVGTAENYVVRDSTIKIPKAILHDIQQRTYEKAVDNMAKFNFGKLYGVFFSIFGTLLVTLFSSTYNPFLGISADGVKKHVIGLTIIFGILGVICLFISVSKKKKADTEVRDRIIKEAYEHYMNNE